MFFKKSTLHPRPERRGFTVCQVNREAYILTEVARASENPMLIPLDYELDDKLFSVNSKNGDEDDIEYIRAKSIDEARSHSVGLFGDENEDLVFVEVEKSLNEQAGKKHHRVHDLEPQSADTKKHSIP